MVVPYVHRQQQQVHSAHNGPEAVGTSIGETKKNPPLVSVLVVAKTKPFVDVRPNDVVQSVDINVLEIDDLVDVGDVVVVMMVFHRMARPNIEAEFVDLNVVVVEMVEFADDMVVMRINLRIPVPLAIVFVAALAVVVEQMV